MKKTLAIILSLMMALSLGALTGCGGSGGDQGSAAKEAEEASPYPMTVDDNDYFTMTVTGYDEDWDEINLEIANKTDEDFTFSADTAVLDGELSMDIFLSTDVAAGTKGKGEITLLEDSMEGYEKGDKINFSIDYELYNSDYETIDKGTVTFDFTKTD